MRQLSLGRSPTRAIACAGELRRKTRRRRARQRRWRERASTTVRKSIGTAARCWRVCGKVRRPPLQEPRQVLRSHIDVLIKTRCDDDTFTLEIKMLIAKVTKAFLCLIAPRSDQPGDHAKEHHETNSSILVFSFPTLTSAYTTVVKPTLTRALQHDSHEPPNFFAKRA